MPGWDSHSRIHRIVCKIVLCNKNKWEKQHKKCCAKLHRLSSKWAVAGSGQPYHEWPNIIAFRWMNSRQSSILLAKRAAVQRCANGTINIWSRGWWCMSLLHKCDVQSTNMPTPNARHQEHYTHITAAHTSNMVRRNGKFRKWIRCHLGLSLERAHESFAYAQKNPRNPFNTIAHYVFASGLCAQNTCSTHVEAFEVVCTFAFFVVRGCMRESGTWCSV